MKKFVTKFNEENFNYSGDLIFDHPVDSLFNMVNYDYFDLLSDHCWFSDYLYIKNITGEDIIIDTEDNKVLVKK